MAFLDCKVYPAWVLHICIWIYGLIPATQRPGVSFKPGCWGQFDISILLAIDWFTGLGGSRHRWVILQQLLIPPISVLLLVCVRGALWFIFVLNINSQKSFGTLDKMTRWVHSVSFANYMTSHVFAIIILPTLRQYFAQSKRNHDQVRIWPGQAVPGLKMQNATSRHVTSSGLKLVSKPETALKFIPMTSDLKELTHPCWVT